MMMNPSIRKNRLVDANMAILWIGIIFLLIAPTAWAENQFVDPIQVTTNPGEDFAPTVSHNGKSLVYVSDRSGNLDLWLKNLGKGVQPPDQQLTFHSAKDSFPTFSPDGMKIVFISTRSDPGGDIYLLDIFAKDGTIKVGEAVQLSHEKFPESDPIWSPDQSSVYFISTNLDTGNSGLYQINVKQGVRSLVLDLKGVNPALSPDGKRLAFVSGSKNRALWVINLATQKRVQITSGKEIDVSPRWALDGKTIYFVRYSDDTNFDGRLSIDDNPNIWSLEVSTNKRGKLRQLTDSSTYDLLPAPTRDDRIYYTSSRGKDIDVWQIPGFGQVPVKSDYGHSLQLAEEKQHFTNQTYSTSLAVPVVDNYAISITSADTTSYTLTATANAGSSQANDSEDGASCATLTLAVTNGSETKSPAECW